MIRAGDLPTEAASPVPFASSAQDLICDPDGMERVVPLVPTPLRIDAVPVRANEPMLAVRLGQEPLAPPRTPQSRAVPSDAEGLAWVFADRVGPPALDTKSAGPMMDRRSRRCRLLLDRLPDGAQDLADLATEEDEGDDCEDRDESEDECVFGEALTLLVADEERRDAYVQTSHFLFTSFPDFCGYPDWVDPRAG